MVLKECRLLSVCTEISTVPLLLMVLEEYKVFVYHWYDLVSMINESISVVWRFLVGPRLWKICQ